ncbi:hypothetical protein B566_EDAN016479, partial [Ephemera danica]
MGGDPNAHHHAWGSLILTPKGQNIVQFIESNDLACLNSGKFTRIGTPNQRNTAIDITITPWAAITFPSSQHCNYHPISSTLQILTHIKNFFKQADWQSYTSNLQNSLNTRAPPQANIHLSYLNFINNLETAASSSIPVSAPKKGHMYNTTLTINECDKAKQKRKEATKKLARLITAQTKDEYDRIHNETRLTLRKAKTLGWVKTCNSFNRQTPMSANWQQVKAYQYSATRSQSDKPGKIDPVDFNTYLCPDNVPSQDEIPPLILVNLDMLHHALFTRNELNAVLSEVTDSAPVADDIMDHEDYIPPEDSIFMYADDLTYSTSADTIQEAIRKAELANYGIAKWLKESDLAINPDKCDFVIFSHCRSKQNYNHIKFVNLRIKRVDQHRLLGIIIDDKLSWKPHCDYLAKTCRQGINILKATCHRWWGANPITATILFKAIIRSRLEYGSAIFGNDSLTQWSRLERIQNAAIRTILGAFPSSPIPALSIESGIPPLQVKCKYLANKFMLKVASQANHPLKTQIQRLYQNILGNTSSYWRTHRIPLLVESWQLIQQ